MQEKFDDNSISNRNEIEKERVLSDAEKLKKGAQYVDQTGSNPRLEFTGEQVEQVREEMKEDFREKMPAGERFYDEILELIQRLQEEAEKERSYPKEIVEEFNKCKLSGVKQSIITDYNFFGDEPWPQFEKIVSRLMQEKKAIKVRIGSNKSWAHISEVDGDEIYILSPTKAVKIAKIGQFGSSCPDGDVTETAYVLQAIEDAEQKNKEEADSSRYNVLEVMEQARLYAAQRIRNLKDKKFKDSKYELDRLDPVESDELERLELTLPKLEQFINERKK